VSERAPVGANKVLVGWLSCQSTRLRTVIGRASAGLVRRLSIGPCTGGETLERRLGSLHGGKRDPLAHGTQARTRARYRGSACPWGVLAVAYLDVDGVTAEAWVFRHGEWREAWLQP